MPTGNLPEGAKKIYEEVYQDAKKRCEAKKGKDCEASAGKQAWSALKGAGWRKGEDGQWHKSANLETFGLTITKASYNKATGAMRWVAVASDTDDDLSQDNMSLELFEDFVHRIETNLQAPEEFRSNFWSGGMPYLSISHYPDLDGKAVPGEIDAVFTDGNRLKSEGTFSDNPLGRAAFRSVCDDLYGENKSATDKKVRISIGFLDWKHRHKDTGTVFERTSTDEICLECLEKHFKRESGNREFLRGQLVHEAMTRVPMNERTSMEVDKSMTTRKEDAASIVGEELAEEVDEQAKLIGKSQALVIKADDEIECEEGESPEDCKKRHAEKAAKKDKSDIVVQESVVVQDFTPAILEAINTRLETHFAELKSVVDGLKSTPSLHILDGAISELKSEFDRLHIMDAPAEDKLRAIQDAYTKLGEQIRAELEGVQVATPSQPESDIVVALSTALAPLYQKLDLLSAQMSKPASVSQSIPQRRSVDPLTVRQQQLASGVVKSTTPKLRAIIERTT